MQTSFELTLYRDLEHSKKAEILSRLEMAWDDERNSLPSAYYEIADCMPYGAVLRITMEIL